MKNRQKKKNLKKASFVELYPEYCKAIDNHFLYGEPWTTEAVGLLNDAINQDLEAPILLK